MGQSDWKEKYQGIIEEMEEGYAEVDLEGNLANVNQALCKIWGFSRDEMIGQNHRIFTTPDQARKISTVFKKVLNTRNPVKSTAYEGFRKDRTKRLVEVSTSLMRDQNGNPSGFREIYKDITEHRNALEQLDAQKNRIGAILQSVRDGIITVDPDMNIIEHNVLVNQQWDHPRF